MFGLYRALWAGMWGLTLRLLAEIAPHRRSRRADRLAQGLWNDMAVALLDGDLVGVDDEIVRLVFPRARQGGGGRRLVRPYRGAVEVFAPAVGALKNHNPIREAVGGDDIGHSGDSHGAGAPSRKPIAYYTSVIYNYFYITIIS